MSCRDTTCDIDQFVAPPTSMYSMNRISAPRAFANSSSGMISSSLTPRIMTVSILKPGKRIDGGVDAGEHARQFVEARQLHESIALQRIEADREAVQAGAPRDRARRREQHGVGGHREIANRRLAGRAARPAPADRGGAAVHRRSGGPCRRRAATKLIDQPLDFLELQDVFARQPEVVLLGHAVLAAKIAAIGDREPQVG